MRKTLLLLLLTLFSFSAIHAKVTWEISNDGTLTISGTGDMPIDGLYSVPWYSRREEIKKVVIEDGVTNIGNHAFSNCWSLTSVTIPNSVTSIGKESFENCFSLTSIVIPNSVTSIGTGAFGGCGLTSVEIPNYVTTIGDNAFNGCIYLTSVVIPNSVTSIEDFTFAFCYSLASVTIPNSVTSIGRAAFSNCWSLTSVTIPNSVTYIGNNAFNNCEKLNSITFNGNTPPEFKEDVFRKVDNSISVYVPSISIEAYKNAMGGLGVLNIQAIPPISLTGSESYTQNSQIDGVDVCFTRYFSGNWESIYLPFSLKYEDWKDDFEVARINGIHQYDDNDDGNIDRTVLEFVKMKNDESVIYPSTPYIIKAKIEGTKTLSAEYTTLYESERRSVECSTTTERFIFTGIYKQLRLSGMGVVKGRCVLDDTGFNIIEGKNYLLPYHWFMEREDRDSAYGINNNNTAKEISIRVVGEETTGIANIQLTSPNTQTYDLNGRKVNENNLKPGIYVKNGKKFVIK